MRNVAVAPFARSVFAIRAQRLALHPSSKVSATSGLAREPWVMTSEAIAESGADPIAARASASAPTARTARRG